MNRSRPGRGVTKKYQPHQRDGGPQLPLAWKRVIVSKECVEDQKRSWSRGDQDVNHQPLNGTIRCLRRESRLA